MPLHCTLAACLAACLGITLNGGESILDTFDAGAAIDAGRQTDDGSARWQASGADPVRRTPRGTIQALAADGGPGSASLTLATPGGEGVLAIEADLVLARGDGWIGLGFGGPALGEWFTAGTGADLFVLVRPDGKLGVFARQNTVPVVADGSRAIPGARPGTPLTVRLEHRPADRTVRVLADGAEVVPWRPLPAGVQPRLERAGVHFQDARGEIDRVAVDHGG